MALGSGLMNKSLPRAANSQLARFSNFTYCIDPHHVASTESPECRGAFGDTRGAPVPPHMYTASPQSVMSQPRRPPGARPLPRNSEIWDQTRDAEQKKKINAVARSRRVDAGQSVSPVQQCVSTTRFLTGLSNGLWG